MLKDLEAKYNNEPVYGEELAKRDGGNQPLIVYSDDGYDDDNYYGNTLVGANPQTFTVKFDTGSSTFFIPGPSCPSTQCAGRTKYSQAGIDEHNTTVTHYADGGSRGGENYLDTVTVGGITVDKTQVVSMANNHGHPHPAPDSLMGLGFGKLHGKPNTFFEDAIDQGKVAKKEFSFYLGRKAQNTDGNSELTLGGRDSSKFKGDPILLPVVSYDHWTVQSDGVVIGGEVVSGTSGTAFMDTGTTIIGVPKKAAAAIYAKIPGSKPAKSGLWTIPCGAKLPDMGLKLSGHTFNVAEIDKIYDKEGSTCYGLFASVGGVSSVIAGDSFLKGWYSIYSYDAHNGKPAVLLAESI